MAREAMILENLEAALAWLHADRASNYALLEVLSRGSGEVLAASSQGLLLRDRRSGVTMLSAADEPSARQLLYCVPDLRLLTCTLPELAPVLARLYGLHGADPCWQFVYDAPEPPAIPSGVTLDAASEADVRQLAGIYRLGGEDDIAEARARGELFTGHDSSGNTVGFIGVHSEGSMGMLEILPAFRRHGYGAALETLLIRERLQGGHLPYCHVLLHNQASYRLQQKLGLRLAARKTIWLFR